MVKKKTVNVDELLQQGFAVIQGEFEKFKKNQTADLLDQKAATILNDYMRTLLAMKREERQANMEEDLEKLDDANLQELAKQAMKFIIAPPNHPAGKVAK